MTYSEKQLIVREHIRTKVEELFANYNAPGHGIEHTARVAVAAKELALLEHEDVFMCELLGWLHDIGRAAEYNREKFPEYPQDVSHHELSFLMLKDWFEEDDEFDVLSKEEKIELLYGVRYHYNDRADHYTSAIILRDADKLDSFGDIGLWRSIEIFRGNQRQIMNDLRYRFQILHYLRTDSAKHIVKERKLMEPIFAYIHEKLEESIEEITI